MGIVIDTGNNMQTSPKEIEEEKNKVVLLRLLEKYVVSTCEDVLQEAKDSKP